MIRAIILTASVFAGCDTMGEIRRSVVDGETLVEHIDTNDQPDGCPRHYTGGCFQTRFANGRIEKHIWRSAVGAPYVERHEKAHKGDSKTPGMRHTAWSLHRWYNANCATITVGYSGYPQGHLLCNDGRSEWTIAP